MPDAVDIPLLPCTLGSASSPGASYTRAGGGWAARPSLQSISMNSSISTASIVVAPPNSHRSYRSASANNHVVPHNLDRPQPPVAQRDLPDEPYQLPIADFGSGGCRPALHLSEERIVHATVHLRSGEHHVIEDPRSPARMSRMHDVQATLRGTHVSVRVPRPPPQLAQRLVGILLPIHRVDPRPRRFRWIELTSNGDITEVAVAVLRIQQVYRYYLVAQVAQGANEIVDDLRMNERRRLERVRGVQPVSPLVRELGSSGDAIRLPRRPDSTVTSDHIGAEQKDQNGDH